VHWLIYGSDNQNKYLALLDDVWSRWRQYFKPHCPDRSMRAAYEAPPVPKAGSGLKAKVSYFQWLLFQGDAGGLLNAVELY
jgi:hypothetical protein